MAEEKRSRKKFKSPEELWKFYQRYLKHIEANPIKVKKWVGKDAKEVEEKHYKPPTWAGFEAFLHLEGVGNCTNHVDLDWYRRNQDGLYNDYQGVIRAIKQNMFDRKFSGAAIGIYQHNIIARELGLAEHQEISEFQRPILENGKELPDDDQLPD